QQPVAGGLDDAAAVAGNRWVHDLLAEGLQRRKRAALVPPHQPRVACDVSRHDGGEAALFRGHRSASAALGSSRPAAMRRQVVARLRSSDRPNAQPPPFNLLLKYSADATSWNVSKLVFALPISPTPTRPNTTWMCAQNISGLSLIARDAQSMPSAYRFATKHA